MNTVPVGWLLWAALIVGIAVARLAIRIKRDGWRITFETAEQRYQRHERERMARWTERDHQRQRFQMATRRDDARPHRAASRPVPPPDISDPSLTQEDWSNYLTTE